MEKHSQPKEGTSASSKIVKVLVEMRVQKGQGLAAAMSMADTKAVPTFELDPQYEAISMRPSPEESAGLAAANEEIVVVRGTIEENKIANLESQPNVVKVWKDTEIAPFACPIPPCDCTYGRPNNGTISDVANYLGANQIWAKGHKGQGIVIGIVDGGTTAVGRIPTGNIPRVIGGYPSNWGKVAYWDEHGNMTATDALGMAPEAQIYDIRIPASTITATISNALAGYQWAINQHKADGTPQILSNSWGIWQKSWDPAYACDPNHPFTRKVVEALDEGIIVLFAAGNCGSGCPSSPKCGSDFGPGKSIWGANGHPRVMTVGAVNLKEEFVGYSSQGPACLDPNKPDFCSLTHFAGYWNPGHPYPTTPPTPSDTGTSAATPIAAGIVALIKQSKSSVTQDQVKDAIKRTAKDIGGSGWDQHSGSGILQGLAAYNTINPPVDPCKRYLTAAQICLRSGNILCYFRNLVAYFLCKYRTTRSIRYLRLYKAYKEYYGPPGPVPPELEKIPTAAAEKELVEEELPPEITGEIEPALEEVELPPEIEVEVELPSTVEAEAQVAMEAELALGPITCLAHREKAAAYLNLYKKTSIKVYLCYSYRFLAIYYYCLYQSTHNLTYYAFYRRYWMRYRTCMASP